MTNPIKEFFESIADNWDNKNDDRNIIEELFKLIDLKENEDVLDLGCGKGIITPYIYQYTHKLVMGIDLSEKRIEGAKKNNPDSNKYNYICGDFFDYEFNQKFDKIIIFNAFPHFLDKEALARKANEILKPKGSLIIMHNLGKERLNNHHNEKAPTISCGLRTPIEEANDLKNYFKLIKSIDEADRYLMVLKKVR